MTTLGHSQVDPNGEGQVMRGMWLVSSCCLAIAALEMADPSIVPLGDTPMQLVLAGAILVGVTLKSRPLRWLLVGLLVLALIRTLAPGSFEPDRELLGLSWYLYILPKLGVYSFAIYTIAFSTPARLFFAHKTTTWSLRAALVASVLAVGDAAVVVATSGYAQWLADGDAPSAPWWLFPTWLVAFFPGRYLLSLPAFNHPFGLGGPIDGLVWAGFIALNAAFWGLAAYLLVLKIGQSRSPSAA